MTAYTDVYYFDTCSLLDLEMYGIAKRLRKLGDVVIVPEVIGEIKDRNFSRRLARAGYNSGPARRNVLVPGLDTLDRGERAVIQSMAADQGGHRRVYVSNDNKSRVFVADAGNICEDVLDTSGIILHMYRCGFIEDDDIRRILSDDTERKPNTVCREKLNEELAL